MISKCKSYSFLILVALFWSCNKPDMQVPQPQKDEQGKLYFENQEDLVKWNNTSEQTCREKEMGGFKFILKRLSPDMLALQELQGNVKDAAALEEAKSHYTGLIYFRFNIQNENYHEELLKYNVKSAAEYSERLHYCAFGINNDFYLTNGRDTVACAIHEFERSYNLESGLNFLVTFPVIDLQKAYTIAFEDKLFKNGIIKFGFDANGNEIPYYKMK